MFIDSNNELYESMKKEYPDTYECVCRIGRYIYKEFGQECSKEEMLYLIIHVNRLYLGEKMQDH